VPDLLLRALSLSGVRAARAATRWVRRAVVRLSRREECTELRRDGSSNESRVATVTCMDLFKHLQLLLAYGAVAVACGGGTKEPSTEPPSTPSTSKPASAQTAEEPAETPPSSGFGVDERASRPPPVSAAVDPCAGLDCPDGYCDLQTVQCVRAPCPPVPVCVRGTHPCAAMTCPMGSRCESHDGEGVCVPLLGGPCGEVTCPADQVCCNASCGICTPPDGACTQQLCK